MKILYLILRLSFFTVLSSQILIFTVFTRSSLQLDHTKPWSFSSLRGTYDRIELQRGFQVYEEVCGSCHRLSLVSYRHLLPLYLPSHSHKEDVNSAMFIIKSIASSKEVKTLDDDGNVITRKGLPSDNFVDPYPNEKASRVANNGSLPPDLSTIAKARQGGVNYIYSILTGYADKPSNIELSPGMFYNVNFDGHQIAMPPPLSDGQISYSDGTASTVDQMARDVSSFLAFLSEPELEQRKQLGIQVIIFLSLLTVMMFFLVRRIWSRL